MWAPNNEFFDGYGYHGRSFEHTYRCYPASFIDKPQLENGDKIIMPPSALDRLASLNIDYPMLFELQNAAAERVSHCGVLEFIAEEGMIYMPYWMMENLLLQEGDIVRVKNVTLPKGTYVKLQPHTKDFLDISNPKAILETTLRNFSCLTTGDSIMMAYNNKKYYIDIIESKPSNAISIIETDCEVDFATPLDYKEPEKPVASVPLSKVPAEGQEATAEAEPKFNPFTGSGRRLDGKPLKYESPPASSSGSRDKRPDVSNGKGHPSAGSSSQGTSRQSQGKLVFGSNANRTTGTQKGFRGRKIMAMMMQWYGAAVKRLMLTTESRAVGATFSSLSSSTWLSSSSTAPATPIVCGRGDKKTKRGKRFNGSFGNSRPKKEKKIERIKDKVEVPRSTPWPLPFKLI